MLRLSSSKDSMGSASSFSRCSDYFEPSRDPPHIYGHKINIDNLISICTAKLEVNPTHRKALFIRASSFMKKRLFV